MVAVTRKSKRKKKLKDQPPDLSAVLDAQSGKFSFLNFVY